MVGQPIKLVWDNAGEVSGVDIAFNDNGWKYSAWKTRNSCVFTPTAAGQYRWSVFVKRTHAETGSAGSEERILLVRPKDGAAGSYSQGAPPPPSPISPSDQTEVKAGRPVTLTWKAAGKYSQVAVWWPDEKWRYMDWRSTASYAFTPSSPGVYVWQVFTANKSDCEIDCSSGGSVQRYLMVR